MNLRFSLGTVVAILAGFGLTTNLQAQTVYSGTGAIYCPPYGVSYSHPIYPYGNYPGFAPYVYGGNNTNVNSPFGYQTWSGPAPKFRADAYSSYDLYQYGLPAHPGQYVPNAYPKIGNAYPNGSH